jgi:hypothetical protein
MDSIDEESDDSRHPVRNIQEQQNYLDEIQDHIQHKDHNYDMITEFDPSDFVDVMTFLNDQRLCQHPAELPHG